MTLRVLIAVTHLLGVGHLTRAAAIARAFARAGHRATLVTGGVPAPLVSTEGVEVVQLPPVRVVGTAFTTLLDPQGRPVDDGHLRARRDILLTALARLRPHVVIAELFPFGRRVLAAEFSVLLETARRQIPPPLILSSIRDILVAPKPSRVEETHRRLGAGFDAVLVHGDPSLVRLDESWPLTSPVRDLVRYTGYVDDGADEPSPQADPTGCHKIVVSGGGSAAGLPLATAALEAAVIGPPRPWRLLMGHGVPEDAFDALRRRAPAHVAIGRARPDFRAVLRCAALSISQAGYNTAVDLLRVGPRAILVPFEGERETEQRLRADHLARRGLAEVLPESALDGQTLAAGVEATLGKPSPAASGIDLDGARTTVAIVENLVGRRTTAPASARIPDIVWSPLDEALRRAADQGRTVALWWRDDDATEHTPALDRLLALSRRVGVPVALAAIPAMAHASLRDRLADETGAALLVHGLAHANHAPPGLKKAELGPDRPLADLRADAGNALALARDRLGPGCLAVMTPPWNRIAPDLVEALPSLGFCGLSAFGHRGGAARFPGLRRVDAHLDPIDWRGARSLVGPTALVAHLAQLVEAQGHALTARGGPLGLLTHHLVQDEAVWAFCEALLERFAAHAHIGLPFVSELFSATVPQNRDRAEP